MNKPTLLMILDGWGHSEATEHNAIAQANTPHYDKIMQSCPVSLLDASGESVGLPKGQMGNSEVGHLHIGVGRQVLQSLLKINEAIENQTLASNPKLCQLLANTHNTLHIIGLLSPGGVHSHETHLLALTTIAAEAGIKHIALHAILDGRDTAPQSAMASLEKAEAHLKHLVSSSAYQVDSAAIASICGRYYAMDRDNRWDRTALAYQAYTSPNKHNDGASAIEVLKRAYQNDLTDEFVLPTMLNQQTIQDQDTILFANFRADRMRQLVEVFTQKDCEHFARKHHPQNLDLATMTPYQKDLDVHVIFPQPSLANTLGECIALQGLNQCRIAETEKFAHVTYFLNGGVENHFPGEDRLLIPSDKSVATYDLAPAMQAKAITEAVTQAIEGGKYQAIICNFANADMVGHSGNIEATIAAIEAIDQSLGCLIDTLTKHQWQAIITADHGNAEAMYNPKNDQAHTAHTSNPVPMIYIGPKAKSAPEGRLSDIAPTMLECLGINPPAEMTGNALIRWESEYA